MNKLVRWRQQITNSRNRDSANRKLIKREAAENRSPTDGRAIPYKDFTNVPSELGLLGEHDVNLDA